MGGESVLVSASEIENTRRRKRPCATKRERSGERSCAREALRYTTAAALDANIPKR